MKDSNKYLLQVSFNAMFPHTEGTQLVIGKNGRPVSFKDLPQRERQIIVELAEGAYNALKAKQEELSK